MNLGKELYDKYQQQQKKSKMEKEMQQVNRHKVSKDNTTVNLDR